MTKGAHVRRSHADRVLPIVYFFFALALFVALLPSALRPPPDQASSSAEFSPDAPPDENQDSILAALSRGTSGTAGSGTGQGPGQPGAAVAAEIEPEAPARACPRGFGNPPRQTESPYSAPCALPFVGDNGGATYQGVTSTEIRIALLFCTACPAAAVAPSYEGDIRTQPSRDETPADRTFRVYQAYFNDAFQFYGRQLRMTVVKVGANEETEMRAGVQEADDSHRAFAVAGSASDAMFDEATRREMVAFGGYNTPRDFYAKRHPYVWGYQMDQSQIVRLAAEFACKSLVGRPAKFAGDASMRTETRKLGVYSYEGENGSYRRAAEFRRELSSQCGATPAVEVNATTSADASTIATTITQFRSAGVTTVVNLSDFLATTQVTQAADAQAYFPEWFVGGTNALDDSASSRRYSPAQWANAFGITAVEMPQVRENLDWYRAYKSMEPTTEPNNNVASNIFPLMMQFANGIQMAGPKLTPQSFATGLMSMPKRQADPFWTIGGGYSGGDWTYADDVGVVWWDPSGTDADGNAGAYRFLDQGRRWAAGQLVDFEDRLFREGETVPPG